MPITYNNLYEQIISLDSLYAAHKQVQKGKRYNDVAAYARDHIEEIIDNLRNELINMTWHSDPYRRFITKKEVKRRKVDEPSYRDRILHNSIVTNVLPYFAKKFIFDSYAVTPGKGQHQAVYRAQDFIRRAAKQGDVYILQGDIHHYYESINHDILIEQIHRTIRDKRLLTIWERIIEGYSADGTPGVGIPIGAVTSQLSANIYLNPFDHFMKECAGHKYYIRYMDDFVLIKNNKEELKSALNDIHWFLDTQTRLTLNPKTHIFKSTQGLDFCGYRIYHSYLLPRKRNVRAARIRFKNVSFLFNHGKMTLKEVEQRVNSFTGYMQHCDGYRTTQSTLQYLNLRGESKDGK